MSGIIKRQYPRKNQHLKGANNGRFSPCIHRALWVDLRTAKPEEPKIPQRTMDKDLDSVDPSSNSEPSSLNKVVSNLRINDVEPNVDISSSTPIIEPLSQAQDSIPPPQPPTQ
ncbi:hypothetical protein L6452_22603 [Arctium lappa]|uniref:Uncharacterized protein n=1 Tax=Arctium lappa TaxID=4217 RepID=A0ACB9B0L6_ARCLA|nr:hypothetical protein L6452_22603 [Arctium lappa]